MFSKHFKSKVIIMFIAYCGPSDVFEPISEWDFDSERQPDNNSKLTLSQLRMITLKIHNHRMNM
jgi:hypothetical protein